MIDETCCDSVLVAICGRFKGQIYIASVQGFFSQMIIRNFSEVTTEQE